MKLKESAVNPARMMRWGSKSIQSCSRKELIQCIFHLARQVAIAEAKVDSQQKMIQQIMASKVESVSLTAAPEGDYTGEVKHVKKSSRSKTKTRKNIEARPA